MQSRIWIFLCGLTLANTVIGDLGINRTLHSDPNFVSYLKEVLENLRKIMPIGVPGAQIPVLDPFEIPDNININVKEGVADFHLNFERKFRIEGLSKFVVQKLDADLAKLYAEGEVVLPKLTATGRYQLDGKVLVFPLYGDGDFRIEVDNAIAYGRFQVKNVNNRLKVEQLNLNANADKIQIQLENLLDPKLSPILNQIINDLGKTVFDKFQPVVMDLLGNILPPLIDKEMGKFTVDEIIAGKFIP